MKQFQKWDFKRCNSFSVNFEWICFNCPANTSNVIRNIGTHLLQHTHMQYVICTNTSVNGNVAYTPVVKDTNCHAYNISEYCVLCCVELCLWFVFISNWNENLKQESNKMSETSTIGPEWKLAFQDVVVILSDGNQTLMQKCLKCGFILRDHGFSKMSHW